MLEPLRIPTASAPMSYSSRSRPPSECSSHSETSGSHHSNSQQKQVLQQRSANNMVSMMLQNSDDFSNTANNHHQQYQQSFYSAQDPFSTNRGDEGLTMATQILTLARQKLQNQFHPTIMSEIEKSQMAWRLTGEWMSQASIQLQNQQHLRAQTQHSSTSRANYNVNFRGNSRATSFDAREENVQEVVWRCVVCTLVNRLHFLACAACSTARNI